MLLRRWGWDRRSTWSIFDAGKICAPEYAGATAQLDGAVADYNGAVVNAIKQTEDAMTQVKSVWKAQRGEQQVGPLASADQVFAYAQTFATKPAYPARSSCFSNAESTLPTASVSRWRPRSPPMRPASASL